MNLSSYFSHIQDSIYINHASSSPLAEPTRERMKAVVDELAFGDLSWDFWRAELAEFRSQAAKLLAATPFEIGFIPNTSTGILIALYSIPWQEEDNILLINDGFPANRVPWTRNLKWMEIRKINLTKETDHEQVIMDAVDSNTRAVVVDWVDFFTGYRLNLKKLGDFCKKRRIFLVVDGIQGVGVIDIDLSAVHVDFLAAGSAKWLLGPVGAGIMYINKESIERLQPALQGWMSLDWEDFNIFDPLPPLKLGTSRFEAGSYPGVPLVGMVENLKILNSVGISKVKNMVFALRKLMFDELESIGAQIISPSQDENTSGILTFRLPGKDSRSLWETLVENRIKASLRQNAIRLSPHFYNTPEQAMTVLEVIKKFNKS